MGDVTNAGDFVTGLATGLDAAFSWHTRVSPPAMTDTALVDAAQSALLSSPYVPHRLVRLEADSGRLILRGAVQSYFQKQMAKEALRTLETGHEIDNQLEVHWR